MSQRETFRPGAKVYFLHPKTGGWCLGSVNSIAPDGKITVDDPLEKKPITMVDARVHNAMEGGFDPSLPDLLSMSDLHPATLMFCIKSRYETKQQQYTRMGDMVISVNPFEVMPYNLEKAMKERVTAGLALNPSAPHCWEIAHVAFQRIVVGDRGNQSILISGESGAGKTETAKTLMNYLGALAASHGANPAQIAMADKVNAKLKATNPILEAFGNAKTVRNDNSSRFGKYIKLFFHPSSGAILGAQMETYLLEKSRIIRQAEGERNYHVFYAFLAGFTDADKKAKFAGVRTAKEHVCLNQGGVFTHRGSDGREVDERAMFGEIVEAFKHVGLATEKLDSMWRILAAILHLQDIQFEIDPSTNVAKVVNDTAAKAAADMLQVSVSELVKTLLVKSQTKIMTNYCNQAEASALRDAVSKALYSALFDWLVGIINKEINPVTAMTANQMKYVGILDIFGFEKFKVNSFEQLCINYANEGLQGHYNAYTFKHDAAECQKEGISCPIVDYPDNQPCLDMIEQVKGGLFALLDEESSYKLGTDKNFTERAWKELSSNAFFIQPKGTTAPEFGIQHYASDVTYTTTGWLEKNVDTLKEDSKQCLLASKDPTGLVQQVMSPVEAVPADGTARKKETVCKKFRGQLRALLDEMHRTESHFVRCIKPNPLAKPREADNAYVGLQLECAGVLQTIAMKRQGYPVRQPHALFLHRYKIIAPKQYRRTFYAPRPDVVSGSRTLLQWYSQGFKWKAPHSDIGHSKVFVKTFVYNTLERCRQLTSRRMLRAVVPFIRRWIQKFRARKAAEEKRRLEELEKLKNQKPSDPAEAARIAKSSGLTPEKSDSFTKAAALFPHFDLPVILDVVYNLPTLDKAVSALMSMQHERVASTQTQSLKMIYAEIGLSPGQQEDLTRNGIITQDQLFSLTESRMQGLGLTKDQVGRLLDKILAQRSERVVTEKLMTMFGKVSIEQLTREVVSAQKKLEASATNHPQTLPSTPAPPQQQQRAPPVAPPGFKAPNAGGSGGMPAYLPRVSTPQGTPQYGAPPPGYGVPTQPQYQQPPQRQYGLPTTQGMPQRAPPPSVPSQQPQPSVTDPQKVKRLMDMGFPQDQVIKALNQNGGDIHKATNALLGS